MKAAFRIAIILVFTFLNSVINGQSLIEDIIYLKNGSVIRGIIVEQVPNESLKIQTKDKNVFFFKFDEIEKITKDLPAESEIHEQNKNSKYKSNELFVQSAQRAFILFNCGYAFNMSSQNISINMSVLNNDYSGFLNETIGSSSYGTEQVNVSLGKGLNLGGAIGYMFNDNIGVELGVSYLHGSKSTATVKDLFSNRTVDKSISAQMCRINPTIIISSGKTRFSPYAKFAFVFASGSAIYEIDDVKVGDVYNVKLKLNGGISLGLNTGIGTNINIGKNTSLFSEINTYNISYSPKKGEYLEANHNGIDFKSSLKEIEFVDNYNNNSPPDPGVKKELKQKLPMGSVGFLFGLKYNF